jgi:type I restriction enzyme S subunit
MSNKHAVKEAPASYQSTPAPLGSRDLQNLISSNPLTEHLNLWISATKAKSTSGRGSNKKIELVGIKKLRELILELAVRGKLVPQNPEDEPASELLKKIDAEKSKLVKEGKIKKQKLLPEMSEDEKPYELPDGWKWVFISSLGHDHGQVTPSEDFTYIDVGAIDNGRGKIKAPNILCASEAPSRARKVVKLGTVIYSTIRPYLKNIAVIENEFDPAPIASTAFAILHPWTGISSSYIATYLHSPAFVNYVESVQTGIAYPAINDKQFFGGVFPLPPYAEQQRIVAKVQELMALCDQLEQHSEHQLDAHKQLVEILLATLVESKNADDLATNWQRLAEHFDTLFSGALTSTAGIGNGGGEWAIDRLKDTILQLAVMGKLVPQNPEDEPASELLKKIDAEKSKLVKEGKIKKQKPLPEITDEEKPFELPDGWAISRIGNVINISSGDGLTSRQMSPEGQIPVYGGNGVNGYHDQYNVSEKTLVIGRVGYYCGSIHITPNHAWVTDNAFVTTFSKNQFSIEYLSLLLRATNLNENDNATAQPVISGRKIYPIPICFPPLAEQQRIVAKVDELFALCDQLKARLQAASETQLTLTEALVEQALS